MITDGPVAERIGLSRDELEPVGRDVAKIPLSTLHNLESRRDGRLVLVTAISPTPAGEGKTTTSVGLADALARHGPGACLCLREPSLGPCMGMKGGATGGGKARVTPSEKINLHFTGDFHAITSAHNLLAAMVDNHIHHGLEPRIDPNRVRFPRVLDVNDRVLREAVTGLGGPGNGPVRETSFDITAASEVMAAFCLAADLADLEARLGRITVAETPDRRPVTAADVGAPGAMTALLADAIAPNLVQTLEGTPALIHGGPFANIAHGCNSVVATRAARKLAPFVVTEAGFGADLGAEKFFDIKCRQTGIRPDAVVLVATARALKMHGGVEVKDLDRENVAAIEKGASNLERHLANLERFGVRPVVALNLFPSDTQNEIDAVRRIAEARGAAFAVASHFRDGGDGARELADAVTAAAEEGAPSFELLYGDDADLTEKIRTVAQRIYGAADIDLEPRAAEQARALAEAGHGRLPVCIAKTQYSFSTDPAKRGAPEGHRVPVRELRLSSGAGFVVAVCGSIRTMPGLPKNPAAYHVSVDAEGGIHGLA